MHCPQCRADLGDLDPHWAPWCESCEWGLDPTPAEDWSTPLERWWQRRLNALSAREHTRLMTNGLVDGPGVDDRLVLLVAGTVHLVTALLAVGVVLLQLTPVWTGFRIVFGLLGAGLVYTLLPLPGRAEERGLPLARDEAPALWSLVDEAAQALGTPSPDRIEVAPWVNASYGRLGWRRRRVLCLGYPLWAALTPQGRVALLGHELGHEANRDLTRRLFVSGAVAALSEWRHLLRTPRYQLSTGSLLEIAVVMARLLAVVLLTPLLVLLLILEVGLDTVSARASQFAEHKCDDLGAELAGTQGSLDAQTLMIGADELAFAAKVPLRGDLDADLWQALERHAASVPEHERRRQLLLARRTLQSVDDEHPPTYRRLELLSTRADIPPRLVLDAKRDLAIQAELQSREPWVRRQLRDGGWS